MSDRDPWAELRTAWRALEAPAPADDWRGADARTRDCVEWMRAAWSEVRPGRALSPPGRDLRGYRPRHAAAAALLVGSLLSFAIGRGGRGQAPPGQVTPAPEEITVAAATPDRLELVSGPVRLVLLSPEVKEEAR